MENLFIQLDIKKMEMEIQSQKDMHDSLHSTLRVMEDSFWTAPVWLVNVLLEQSPDPEPREPPESPEPLPEALKPVPERASSCRNWSSISLEVEWVSWLADSLGASSYEQRNSHAD